MLAGRDAGGLCGLGSLVVKNWVYMRLSIISQPVPAFGAGQTLLSVQTARSGVLGIYFSALVGIFPGVRAGSIVNFSVPFRTVLD